MLKYQSYPSLLELSGNLLTPTAALAELNSKCLWYAQLEAITKLISPASFEVPKCKLGGDN